MSKEVIRYRCPDCGAVTTYPADETGAPLCWNCLIDLLDEDIEDEDDRYESIQE